MKARPTEERTGQERALTEFVERVSNSRDGRQVLHLHLSRLQPVNRRPHHLRIVVNTIQPLVEEFYGQTFYLGNYDLVLALRGASLASIDAVILKVRYLFGGDPICQDPDETHGLVTLYELKTDFEAFEAAVHAMSQEETRRQKRVVSTLSSVASAGQPSGPAVLPENGRIDLHRLGDLTETLAKADLSNFLRRQSICALMPEGPPESVFQELYLSVPDICGQLMPEYQVTTDKWLFQHLTQTLDKRMLDLLARNEDTELTTHVSININISTILSPEFSTFDAGLKPATRGAIIFEVQLVDVFNDLSAFIFARDYARSRGYRFCLDGLDDQSIGFIDREHLGMDLIKLLWVPTLTSAVNSGRAEELRRTIHRIGRHRVILCRCGEPSAIKFGQSVGIALYQGRQIERLATSAVAPVRRQASR